MVQFRCKCGRMLKASEADVGQDARCPSCGAIVPVPPASQLPPPPAPSSPLQEEPRIDDFGEYGPAPITPPRKRWGLGLVLVLALAGVLLFCVAPAAYVWWAMGKARGVPDRAKESANLQILGQALSRARGRLGALPQAAAFHDSRGGPGLSWRVAILPYIEQKALYSEFHLDEPWDSPHNKRLLGRMPVVFLRPSQKPSPEGTTHYLAVTGTGSAFDQDHPNLVSRAPFRAGQLLLGLRDKEFSDGESNTVLVVTAEKAVPWTKPDDFDYTAGLIGPRLLAQGPDSSSAALFADGTVSFLKKNALERRLRAFMTIAGNDDQGRAH